MEWIHDLDAGLQQGRSASKFVWLDIFNPG